jgi:PST family polysaccharide transporter
VIQQVQLTAVALATFGGGTALIQGIASREREARSQYLASTFWLFIAAAALASFTLLLTAPWVAPLLAGGNGKLTTGLLRWIALPVGLGVLFTYFSSILNGFQAIGRLAAVKVTGAAVMALMVYPACLLVQGGHPTAFVWLLSAPMLVQALLCFFTASREGWLRPILYRDGKAVNKDAVRHFLSVAIVLLITGQIANGAMLMINALLVRHDGFASVGVFNAAWSLSMNYVLLILTSFSTYYLPTLSRAKDQQDRVTLMRSIFRLSLLAIVPLLTALIVLKPLVITTLYSGEFTGALAIIRWMLIGNFLRVFGWIFAMPALAYADMKVYFWTEAGWYLGFLGLSALSILGFHSVEGIGFSFIMLYAGYLAYYVSYVRNRQRFVVSKEDRRIWLVGFAVIIAASIHSWNSIKVDWISSTLWILVAAGFSLFVLRVEERRKILLMVKARLGEAG